MGRKFFTAFVVASCAFATTGLVNVAGASAASKDPVISRAKALAAHAGNIRWVAGPHAGSAGAGVRAVGQVTVSDATDDEEIQTGPNTFETTFEPSADLVSAQAGVDGNGSIFRWRTD